MKTNISKRRRTALVVPALTILFAPAFLSCESLGTIVEPVPAEIGAGEAAFAATSPESVARLLSEVPLELDQVREVWKAVTSSAENGYDEEYLFKDLLTSPGAGVGDVLLGKEVEPLCAEPLSVSLSARAERVLSTRAGDFCMELGTSDLQIYWPYSEDWDGVTMPVITYNPENGLDRVTAFRRSVGKDGKAMVEEFLIDESYALENPVWVVNRNEDASYMTPQMVLSLFPDRPETRAAADDIKTLKLKDLKAHRNYDSWLAGASEFVIKCGSLENFKATTMDEMKEYNISMTDCVIVVKRKQVGNFIRLNSILVSEWTDQLVNCGYFMIEDDGGTMTTWKCNATVKIKSKSYGMEIEFPYRKSDDNVWRGTLSRTYLESVHNTPIRLGDVSVTFTLD